MRSDEVDGGGGGQQCGWTGAEVNGGEGSGVALHRWTAISDGATEIGEDFADLGLRPLLNFSSQRFATRRAIAVRSQTIIKF